MKNEEIEQRLEALKAAIRNIVEAEYPDSPDVLHGSISDLGAETIDSLRAAINEAGSAGIAAKRLALELCGLL